MNAGVEPFMVNAKGELELVFRPALKKSFFTTERTSSEYFTLEGKAVNLDLPACSYAFNFMGRTLVIYHNPLLKDTFGAGKAEIKRIVLHYPGKKIKEIAGAVIPCPFAQDVRQGKVVRIHVEME